MVEILGLLLAALLINNVLLARFLGVCPFLGVSANQKNATGMGLAVLFVMTMASMIAWLLNKFVLVQFDMVYMRTIVFILVIACLVQIIEMFIKKFSQKLYKALGIYLPLITTNCAVLGVATLVVDSSNNFNFFEAILFALGSAFGFLLVMVIFSGLREKMARAPIPKAFQGIPIALMVAAMMAMIFGRFAGVA